MRCINFLFTLPIFIFITGINGRATSWTVSPDGPYFYCSQVEGLVQDGDSVFIEFGNYINDPQVIWTKNDLFIAGVGGRPRLEAGEIIANDAVNGKGIFVISGNNVHVHNIEFANAAVMDHNGAGIRQEGKDLLITSCFFVSNEMGILCGNIDDCTTTIEYCEFFNGGSTANPGYQHNVYINHIDTLIFRFNYSHDAIAEGHELKSRASNNIIMYNRIANETSVDSRTIDLPNGGHCVIVGNIIEQGPNSANSNLLGYGLEGLSNAGTHDVYITNNTFINKKSTGSFIDVSNGAELLYLKNNILVGASTGGLIIGNPLVLDSTNNVIASDISTMQFVDADAFDYHLLMGSPAIDAGQTDNTIVMNYSLFPTLMYQDTCSYILRSNFNEVDCGAFETPDMTNDIWKNEAALSIYPNPAGEYINVTLRNGLSSCISVYNVQGKKVLETSVIKASTLIDVSSLPTGIYLVCCDSQEVLSGRIIQVIR